jgi:hypothetical protein
MGRPYQTAARGTPTSFRRRTRTCRSRRPNCRSACRSTDRRARSQGRRHLWSRLRRRRPHRLAAMMLPPRLERRPSMRRTPARTHRARSRRKRAARPPRCRRPPSSSRAEAASARLDHSGSTAAHPNSSPRIGRLAFPYSHSSIACVHAVPAVGGDSGQAGLHDETPGLEALSIDESWPPESGLLPLRTEPPHAATIDAMRMERTTCTRSISCSRALTGAVRPFPLRAEVGDHSDHDIPSRIAGSP